VPYAGGHSIETRWGTFVGTNLTPDPEHGLGEWTFDDFVRAMRRGRGPGGERYWPAFPFQWFGHTTDADLADLWAFLRALPPEARPDEAQAPLKRFAGMLGMWRLVAFTPARPGNVGADLPEDVGRGAYLVQGLGHCGGCHTPRTGLGRPVRDLELAGTDGEGAPRPSPNLTPHPDGLGGWSSDDVVTFLELAMTPEGDFVGGAMGEIVHQGTSKLPRDDREAIAAYLRSLPPRP
jgi:mono/diheme cytochrome c family protein